jgi:Zn-dependent oligopeptidase
MGIFSLFASQKNRVSTQENAQVFAGAAPAQDIHAMDSQSYLASDEKEWLRYLSQALRTYRKPGVSLKEEHQQWLAARAQSRALMAAASARVARSN